MAAVNNTKRKTNVAYTIQNAIDKHENYGPGMKPVVHVVIFHLLSNDIKSQLDA